MSWHVHPIAQLQAYARNCEIAYIVDAFAYPRDPALFLTRYGTRLGPDAYGHIFKKTGLNAICTLHGLRHACATHMLRNGADIRLLQKLLGHRKLSSTQIYTHVDRTDLAKLLSEHHPRG